MSVRGRSDLAGVAPTWALLQKPPSHTHPELSSQLLLYTWTLEYRYVKGLSGFIFKGFPLLFFS